MGERVAGGRGGDKEKEVRSEKGLNGRGGRGGKEEEGLC